MLAMRDEMDCYTSWGGNGPLYTCFFGIRFVTFVVFCILWYLASRGNMLADSVLQIHNILHELLGKYNIRQHDSKAQSARVSIVT